MIGISKSPAPLIIALVVSLSLFFASPVDAAASCPNVTRDLYRGVRGDAVLQLQQFFVTELLLPSDAKTGFFGPMTENAVKQWQIKNGVVASGTAAATGFGRVGPKTRKALSECRLSPVVTTASATTTVQKSCTFNNQTIAHGSSIALYRESNPTAGTSCLPLARLCANGVLLGEDVYRYQSCTATGNTITIQTPAPIVTPTPPLTPPPVVDDGTVNVVVSCGAKNDGVVDNRAALQGCIDRYAATGTTLLFPAGRYLVNGTLKITSGKIALAGTDRSSTYLIQADASATLIDISRPDGQVVNEMTIRDLSLQYASLRAPGTLITLNNAWRISIQHVIFGSTGEDYRMGAQGIAASGGARLFIESSIFAAPMVRAIHLNNTSDTHLTSLEINMSEDASVHAKGILFENNANGVYAVNLNVTSGDTAFEFIRSDPTGPPPSWMFFTNSLADTQKVHGWFFKEGKSITLTNSWSASAGLQGIVVGAVDGLAVNGSRIYNNGQDGIFINAEARNTQITNSRVSGNSRTQPGASSGVVIAPGASGVTMQGNVIGMADSFSNTQAYGIAIPAGASDNLLISNNNLANNTLGGLLNQSTGASQSITGNLGQ